MRISFAVFIAYSFCAGCAPPYDGPGQKYYSPGAVPFYLRSGVSQNAATIGDWIDRRVAEWIQHKVDWGCQNYTDRELEWAAQAEPLDIFPGYIIYGDYIMGMNYMGNSKAHIDISVDYPPVLSNSPYDPPYAHPQGQSDLMYSYGLRQLPHELTHTVRGTWHP